MSITAKRLPHPIPSTLQISPPNHNTEQKLLTKEENTPASKREHKQYQDNGGRDVLRRKVVDLSGCGIVLFRESEEGWDAYKDKPASLSGSTTLSLLDTNRWLNRSQGQKQRV